MKGFFILIFLFICILSHSFLCFASANSPNVVPIWPRQSSEVERLQKALYWLNTMPFAMFQPRELSCCSDVHEMRGADASLSIVYPIFCDSALEADIPRNLRAVQQVQVTKSSLNLTGLNNLKISGSGQFSEKTFMAMIRYLPIRSEKLIVIDLRQESHGFINGQPVSWTDGNHNYANANKTKSEIEADEYQRLRLAVRAKQIVINPLKEPIKLSVFAVKTERDLVESYGSTYIRLPVQDHNRPANEIIDQFIQLVKSLSSDYWIHIHCKGGKGRTTTFLTLYDIIQNAHHVSLQDILARQYLMGGVDLTLVQKEDRERTRAAHERLAFIQQFYLYCQQVPNFDTCWSDWDLFEK
jgi:hypothetical protein